MSGHESIRACVNLCGSTWDRYATGICTPEARQLKEKVHRYLELLPFCSNAEYIVMASHPYGNRLVPDIGCPLAFRSPEYTGSYYDMAPASVQVVAEDIYRMCKVSPDHVALVLMNAVATLPRGVVFLNSDPYGAVTALGDRGRECNMMLMCHVLDLCVELIRCSPHAKVTLIAMGVPAAGIMGRVCSAVPGRTKLRCTHNPVYYARRGIPDTGRIMEGNKVAEAMCGAIFGAHRPAPMSAT